MTKSTSVNKTLQLAVRWTARVSSILVISVFLLMFFGEGFDPSKVKPNEWVMMVFGPFGLILGMILGWWKEGLGGVVTILCYLIALRVGGFSGSGAGIFLICAAPGFLFLLSWFLSRSAALKSRAASEETPPQPPTSEKP